MGRKSEEVLQVKHAHGFLIVSISPERSCSLAAESALITTANISSKSPALYKVRDRNENYAGNYNEKMLIFPI